MTIIMIVYCAHRNIFKFVSLFTKLPSKKGEGEQLCPQSRKKYCEMSDDLNKIILGSQS